MEIDGKNKKAGAVVATISVIILVLAGLFASGMLGLSTAREMFPEEHLFVDATYLLKTGETNETVNVTCILYLTNIWEKESGKIKTTVYVIEAYNNLAVYKNTVVIGEISANATAEIEIPVVLSNSSYKIEILIFENEKLVLKGVITISAYPIYSWDEIVRGAQQQWQISNAGYSFENIRLGKSRYP